MIKKSIPALPPKKLQFIKDFAICRVISAAG